MAVTTVRFISIVNYGVLTVKLHIKNTQIVILKSLNR